MSTSNKKNKNTFIYSPSQQDVDAYIKFKSGESKQKSYMKDYKALHHIEGLSDNSILVYEAIRNLVGMYVLQQKYRESYKKQKAGKLGSIGVTRTTTSSNARGNNTSVVGTTMIITNPMLQEWIGNKSHNTIKSALEQLESMGFIKCSTDTTKKTGRKVTLLRDMEEYQPEEIEALEAYIKGMRDTESVGNEEISTENEKPKKKRSAKSENKKNEIKKDEVQNDSDESKSDEDELDDFDF